MRARVLAPLAFLAAGVFLCALASMRQPFGTGDFLAIWGLKARALERGGLPSVFRIDPRGEFSHPEYPLLWPLGLGLVSRLEGRWDELLLTPLWPALCLAAALLAARAARGLWEVRLLGAAFVALLPYWRRYPGYAEGLLAVLLLAAVTEARRLPRGPWAEVRLAVFLTLAAWTKPEGALAGLIVAGALAAGSRVRPALLCGLSVLSLAVLPWSSAVRRLAPDVGSAFDLRSFGFAKLSTALGAAARDSVSSLPFVLAAVALLLLAPRARRAARGELAAAALFCGALLLSYGFSRFDPGWHALWSWDRVAFLALAALAPALAEAAGEALGWMQPERA